jgi:hypothetical protein
LRRKKLYKGVFILAALAKWKTLPHWGIGNSHVRKNYLLKVFSKPHMLNHYSKRRFAHGAHDWLGNVSGLFFPEGPECLKK